MASTNPARGMRDFLPADVRKRNYVIGIIKEVYESYGFEPLETPSVENLETLMGKYGDEGNQLVFKILKRGEKLRQETGDGRQELKESDLSDLALRYDLTVPLARVVANNKNELPKFFKRYQIQPVWRADRPARGRFREFYQCDVDAIGSQSHLVEAELISAVCEILGRLGFENYIIRVNHREILSRMLAAAGVAPEKNDDALIALDKFDKIGREGVELEFRNRNILQTPEEQEARQKLIDVFLESFDVLRRPEIIDRGFLSDEDVAEVCSISSGSISSYLSQDVRGLQAVNNLLALLVLLLKLGQTRIVFDPSLARGLSYYTGTIMEINVPDLAGSLGGGGRYDGLIGMFGKEQIPACGFSLGLERILVVMEERGMFPPEIAESTPADVMVTIWGVETSGESLKLASELRAAGIRTTVYPEADKLGKQFKYADSIKVPWVCVIGESEIAENQVTLKNLSTGEQNTYPRAEIASKII